MDSSQSSSKKSQSRSRRTHRSKKSQSQQASVKPISKPIPEPITKPIPELEPIPETQSILLLKSEADAEKDRGSPRGRNITKGHVSRMTYPFTEKDQFDGIVFLVGHSEFKKEQQHLFTRPLFHQHTLLVANVGNTCHWFSDPKTVEAFIRERFSDALSYAPTNIEEFIHTVKSRIRQLPKMKEKIDTRPDYKSFYDARGKFSNSLSDIKYYEREWEFFTQDNQSKPDGRVMLLRRDKNGNPYFKALYVNDINNGGFRLTKTKLYDKLYDDYHLRNVLLVDFGCTNIRGVDKFSLLMIRKGYFGGKSTYKKYNPKSKK